MFDIVEFLKLQKYSKAILKKARTKTNSNGAVAIDAFKVVFEVLFFGNISSYI